MDLIIIEDMRLFPQHPQNGNVFIEEVVIFENHCHKYAKQSTVRSHSQIPDRKGGTNAGKSPRP